MLQTAFTQPTGKNWLNVEFTKTEQSDSVIGNNNGNANYNNASNSNGVRPDFDSVIE